MNKKLTDLNIKKQKDYYFLLDTIKMFIYSNFIYIYLQPSK